MRTPKSRARKVFITDELIELYRAALPAWQAHWREIITGKELTHEERIEAIAKVQAFNRAANVMPWEISPLSPRPDGHHVLLQKALLARVNGIEARTFRRFARAWQKQRDQEAAEFRRQQISPAGAAAGLAAARKRLKLPPSP